MSSALSFIKKKFFRGVIERFNDIETKLEKIDRIVSSFFDDKYGFDFYENYKSQLGADLWVLKNLNFKSNGFFVEFGAYDGVKFSNTFLLEKKFSWTGILAEPQKSLYEQAKLYRNCVVTNELISDKTGDKIEFLETRDALATIVEYVECDRHKESRKEKLSSENLLNLTSISLNDFLLKYNCPKDIDYISIDTEGSEYRILECFPFEDWNIKMFSIEHNFEKNRESIYNLLSSHGYKRIKRSFDDWYIKE